MDGATIRIIVTGAAGMLGTALLRTVGPGIECIPATRADADLASAPQVDLLLSRHRPQCVIHAAAYADVDGCTRDPERAMRDNALASAVLARACTAHGARLVMVSTDYVFSGEKTEPYAVDDPPDPVNVYGESKARAEAELARAMSDYLIVRTQWLYGPGGRSFVAAILKRAAEGSVLRVVDDEFGSPTCTDDLARALWQAAASTHTGIMHVTNSGVCNRLELARATLECAGMDAVAIDPLHSAEWPSPTRRPLRAILDTRRWSETGHEPLPHWRDALAACMPALWKELNIN